MGGVEAEMLASNFSNFSRSVADRCKLMKYFLKFRITTAFLLPKYPDGRMCMDAYSCYWS
jgi:hypothetical protein